MSAPVSRDPLVVNTQDGSCWVRRAVTRDGRGLYALEGAPRCCPEYVLASLRELAEFGLRSMADVLPVPAGNAPQPLSPEQERAIRSLDLLALMSDRVAPVISGHLAALLAEIDRLRAERHETNEALSDAAVALRADRDRIAELEAQRDRRRDRLVALQNDALNMRGALSPNGEERKVSMPLGDTLTPAVEWLIARVAELEALTPAPIQTCRKCGAGYTYGEPCSNCVFRAQMAAETAGRVDVLDGEHYAAAHHDYRTSRDLPETGGAR